MAEAGQAVTLTLEDEVDVARGDILVLLNVAADPVDLAGKDPLM